MDVSGTLVEDDQLLLFYDAAKGRKASA